MEEKSIQSDLAYIQQIRQGNKKVIEQLYRVNFAVVAHFIVVNNGTLEEAKDIYQEAFMLFYEKAKKDDFTLSCKIKTFLYSICRNLWLQKLSQKNKVVQQEDIFPELCDTGEECEEIQENEKRFAQMHSALAALGEPCKGLIEDFYIHNRSMEDIKVKYSYTNTDNAKNQKYKCLQRLKKIFFNT